MKKRKKPRFKINFKHNPKPEQEKANISNYSYKIGNKNIKLKVERIELEKKSGDTGSIFYFNCAFCNKDFDQDTQICPACNRPLSKVNLKKCPHCGAKNSPSKQNCWVCNAVFPKLEENIIKESQILLTLNIDNRFYRNTDKVIGLGMRKLFDDLIASGFSKEPLEAWLKLYEGQEEFQKEFAREECRNIVKEARQRQRVSWLVFFIPIIICLLLFMVFWVK